MKFYHLVFIVLLFSSCSLAIRRADRLYREALVKRPVYDAIIVPGVPFQNGRWDSIMKARVIWSVYLYKNHFTKNIIYSGGAVYSHFYEAVIMGLYAQKMGVDKSHIFYDTLAKHSTENIYYSYLVAKKLRFKSVAVATDPFQSALLSSYTKRRFRSPIAHLPVNFEVLKTLDQSDYAIDSMQAFREGFESIYIKERFFKRLWGTLGRQVYYGPDKVLGKL